MSVWTDGMLILLGWTDHCECDEKGERAEALSPRFPRTRGLNPRSCRSGLEPELDVGSDRPRALEEPAHRVDLTTTVPVATALLVGRVQDLDPEFATKRPGSPWGSPMRRSG